MKRLLIRLLFSYEQRQHIAWSLHHNEVQYNKRKTDKYSDGEYAKDGLVNDQLSKLFKPEINELK